MIYTRREALRLAALGLAGTQNPAMAAEAQDHSFHEPPLKQRSQLDLDIMASPARLRVAGQHASLLTYGNSFPGPTLRFREGDRVRIRLTNRLGTATNLHWHGLHISPSVDNVLREIPSGESAVYEFTVPKGAAGTYWYHPHLHGTASQQLFAGLAGAIVIEGPLDATPELREAEEHVVILKDLAVAGGAVAPHNAADWMNGKEGDLLLVNGALGPVLPARRASLRLRLLNASNARYYRLKLEGHPLYLIATDGGFIEKPVETSELLLAPGERAEVLVRLTREGTFRLLDLPYDRGTQTMGQSTPGASGMPGMPGMPTTGAPVPHVLLSVVAPSRPKPLPLPARLATLERLTIGGAAVNRRIVLTENMMQARFFINGKAFDRSRVDFQAQRGSLEIWTVENRGDMDHPFHLHTFPVQVLSRNGVPAPYRAWKDTVNLRKGDVVRLAVPMRDYTGRTVFHCHIIEHEDRGMMAVLQVD